MIYSGFNQAKNKKKVDYLACQNVSRATYQRKNHETKTREKLTEMVFCYQNSSDQLWEKIQPRISKLFLDHYLEQFIQTVKGQNN